MNGAKFLHCYTDQDYTEWSSIQSFLFKEDYLRCINGCRGYTSHLVISLLTDEVRTSDIKARIQLEDTNGYMLVPEEAHGDAVACITLQVKDVFPEHWHKETIPTDFVMTVVLGLSKGLPFGINEPLEARR